MLAFDPPGQYEWAYTGSDGRYVMASLAPRTALRPYSTPFPTLRFHRRSTKAHVTSLRLDPELIKKAFYQVVCRLPQMFSSVYDIQVAHSDGPNILMTIRVLKSGVTYDVDLVPALRMPQNTSPWIPRDPENSDPWLLVAKQWKSGEQFWVASTAISFVFVGSATIACFKWIAWSLFITLKRKWIVLLLVL